MEGMEAQSHFYLRVYYAPSYGAYAALCGALLLSIKLAGNSLEDNRSNVE
jgi:hypothetical protein